MDMKCQIPKQRKSSNKFDDPDQVLDSNVQLWQVKEKRLVENIHLHCNLSGRSRDFESLLNSIILVCVGSVGSRWFDASSPLACQDVCIPMSKMWLRIRNIYVDRFLEPSRCKYARWLEVPEMSTMLEPHKNDAA